MLWLPFLLEGIRQNLHHLLALQLVLHADCKAFAGVFVNHRQEPYRYAVLQPIRHEVITPDMVRIEGAQTDAGAVIQTHTLAHPFGNPQPFLTPDPQHAFVAHPPALADRNIFVIRLYPKRRWRCDYVPCPVQSLVNALFIARSESLKFHLSLPSYVLYFPYERTRYEPQIRRFKTSSRIAGNQSGRQI